MKPIFTYQNGGDFAQLLVDYEPFLGIKRLTSTDAGSRASSSKSDSDKSNKVGLKDLLGLVKELDGLPIDNELIGNKIASLYQEAVLFNDGEVNTSSLITTYLSTLRDIRLAKYNKDEYNAAKELVTKNGGYSEAAIDKRGNIFILDTETGEILNVSPQQYRNLAGRGLYEVLTNAELLTMRANNPNLAFKNDILNTVSNGIGIEQVTKMISDIKSTIGTSTLQQEGYSAATSKGIIGGIEALNLAQQKGMSVEGLYKQKLITESQVEEAKLALNYIWSTLPANAKARLKVVSAERGDKDVTKGAFSLIGEFIQSGLTSKNEFSLNLVKNPDGSSADGSDGSSGGSGKGDKSDKVNFFTNLQNQEGGTDGVFMLNPGTQYSMTINGAVYGNLKDNDWNPIGNTSMANVLNKGLSGIIQSMHGISFGDKVLKPEDLNDIMYDNGGAMVVDLPSKIVNGTKVVDLDIVNQYNEARKLYDQQRNGEDNPELLGKILSDKGLDELLDDNGLPDKNRFCRFLIVTGYAVDKDDKFSKKSNGEENKFIEEVDNPDNSLIGLIQTSLSPDGKSNYEIDTHSWANPGDWFNNYDHIYKGNLYIPLSENEIASHDAGKETLPYYIQHMQQEKYQLKQKQKIASNVTGADILNIH